MWTEFLSHLIVYSFESCGILSKIDLHTALKHVLKTNSMINDYVDNYDEADNIDGFENSNELFNELGEIDIDINNNKNVVVVNDDAINYIPSSKKSIFMNSFFKSRLR
jgi:hypothetical protein